MSNKKEIVQNREAELWKFTKQLKATVKATRGKSHHRKKKAHETILIPQLYKDMGTLVKNDGMEHEEVKVKSYWASLARLWILKSL